MRWTLPLMILGLAIATAWAVRHPGEPWRPPPAISPAVAEWPNQSHTERAASFEQALARPPFWATRRPVVEWAPAPSVAVAQPLEVHILGVVAGGARATLIIRDDQGSRRLAQGEVVAGWSFERIDDGQALFSQGGRVERVEIPRPRVTDLPALKMENPTYPTRSPAAPVRRADRAPEPAEDPSASSSESPPTQ